MVVVVTGLVARERSQPRETMRSVELVLRTVRGWQVTLSSLSLLLLLDSFLLSVLFFSSSFSPIDLTLSPSPPSSPLPCLLLFRINPVVHCYSPLLHLFFALRQSTLYCTSIQYSLHAQLLTTTHRMQQNASTTIQ